MKTMKRIDFWRKGKTWIDGRKGILSGGGRGIDYGGAQRGG